MERLSPGEMSPGENARRLQLAYLAVLGEPSTRSIDQQLVWNDIESFCYAYRLSCEGKPDGDLSNNLYMNEGRRSFYLRARGQIIQAMAEPKPAVKVTRRRKPTSNPT